MLTGRRLTVNEFKSANKPKEEKKMNNFLASDYIATRELNRVSPRAELAL